MLTDKEIDRALAEMEAKIRKEEEETGAKELEKELAKLFKTQKRPRPRC